MVAHEHGASKQTRSRARYGWIALGLGALLLSIPVAWLALHASADEMPEPMWTIDDLPPLPPDEENGWVLLATSHRSMPSRTSVRGTSIPHDALKAWRIEVDGAALRTHEPTAQFYAVCEQAFARPRLADACPPEIDPGCPHLALFSCFELAQAHAIVALDEGDPVRAANLLSRTAARSADLAESARSTITFVLGARALATTLELARLGEESDPSFPYPFHGGSGHLERYRALNHRGAVIGEYLIVRDAFDVGMQEEQEMGTISSWGYDRDDTLERIDAIFRAEHRGDPHPAPAQSELFWFVHNPSGKVFVDLLTPEILFQAAYKTSDELLEAIRKAEMVDP